MIGFKIIFVDFVVSVQSVSAIIYYINNNKYKEDDTKKNVDPARANFFLSNNL